MSQGRSWTRFLLNTVLAVAGLLVLVLVYGLATRALIPPIQSARTDNPGELLGDIVQVEVRNGCGAPGVAAAATDHLRRRGFDVVASGNWVRFDEPHTRVLDRVGNREAALRVAHVLGLDESRVSEDLDPRFFVDATVIIGLDYDELPPFRDVLSR